MLSLCNGRNELREYLLTFLFVLLSPLDLSANRLCKQQLQPVWLVYKKRNETISIALLTNTISTPTMLYQITTFNGRKPHQPYASSIQVEMQFSKCFFFSREEKRSIQRKSNRQKTQATYGTGQRTEPKEHWREALDTKDILEVHLAPKKQEFI